MNLFTSHISEESKALVKEVLDSGFVNQGPMVKRFENELSLYGLKNPITVNSCTAALHIALECCEVKGKEVILPAQTFVATGLAVLMAGGIPRFVDIELDGNISSKSVGEAINKKTGAIVVVHWGGKPCNMFNVGEITEKSIPLIEDAAHAFGATYYDHLIGNGSFSTFTCFSLQAIKMLTTGDGGIICSHSSNYIDQIQKMKWFGINKNELRRNPEGDRSNDIDSLGYKYNMNDIEAAIGIGNLHDLDWRLKKRTNIAQKYNEALGKQTRQHIKSSNWLYTILANNKKDRSKLIHNFRRAGINVGVVDTRIDKNSVFEFNPNLKNQELFDEIQLCIPIHEHLTESEILHISDALYNNRKFIRA